jgi:hypothetical protein
MVEINNNYCLAFRNAITQNQQCNKLPIENSQFCCRHNKSHILADPNKLVFSINDTNQYKIITISNFNLIKLYQVTKDELKYNCSLLNLSTNGTKKTLFNNIFNHFSSLKKQQFSISQKKYNINNCINKIDPITQEPFSPNDDIFFLKDKKSDLYYGFLYESIYNIITLGDKCNPYNREKFNDDTINTVTCIYKNTSDNYTIDLNTLSPLQKVHHIFYFADYNAGYYTNYKWFTDLSRSQYINLYFEMMDLWNFRMQWSKSLQNDICNKPIFQINNLNKLSLNKIKLLLIKTTCDLCFSSKNKDYGILGVTLFLTALTMVSFDAASGLPMLVQESSLIPQLVI